MGAHGGSKAIASAGTPWPGIWSRGVARRAHEASFVCVQAATEAHRVDPLRRVVEDVAAIQFGQPAKW